MRAPRPGFVGPFGALPVSAAAAPSSRICARRPTTSTTRRLWRSTGVRAAHPTHSLRASATPPARPATTSARPAAATEASRRGRSEGGATAPPSPSPSTSPTPPSSSSAASAKQRATGTTSSPSTSATSPPPTPPPLSSAAAADAASRAAAAAYAANLGTVIETLRSDYPHLLTRPPVGSIYTPDVAFVSAGLTTAGAGAYGALWWAVRSVARLLLVRGEVAITSLYADASAGRVYVRWRLTGALRGGGGGTDGVDGGSGLVVAATTDATTAGPPRGRASGVGGGWRVRPGTAGGASLSGAAASGGGGGRRLVRDGMSVYTVGPTGLVTKHELVGTLPTWSRLSSTSRGGGGGPVGGGPRRGGG
ncbi:hypothetical protein MMPV_002629 [Pyropia vietnamensis]